MAAKFRYLCISYINGAIYDCYITLVTVCIMMLH